MGYSRGDRSGPNGWLLLLLLGWLLMAGQSLAADLVAGDILQCECPQQCPAGSHCMSKEIGYILKKAEPCPVPGTCECHFLPYEFVMDCLGAFCCKDADSCSSIRAVRYWDSAVGAPTVHKTVKVPEGKKTAPCDSICTDTHGPGSSHWSLWVNRLPSGGFPVCQGKFEMDSDESAAEKQRRRDAAYKYAVASGFNMKKNCDLCDPADAECAANCEGQFTLYKNRDSKDMIAAIFIAIVCVMFLFGVFKMTRGNKPAASLPSPPMQVQPPSQQPIVQRPTEEQLTQARTDPEAASRMGLPNATEQAAIARNDPEAARLMGLPNATEPSLVQASVVGMPLEVRDVESDKKEQF